MHHTTPRSKGGTTAERTGVLLCTPAHAHRHHWTAHLGGNQVTWTPPTKGTGDPGDPQVVQLRQPPPWKPALDALITTWQHQLHQTAATRRDTG